MNSSRLKSPLEKIVGKQILSAVLDGNNIAISFSDHTSIVVYSRINMSITDPCDNLVENVVIDDDKIVIYFKLSFIEVIIDKELLESFVAEINGVTVVG